ncbi:hypothetical protein BRYFOR_05188 [Marvinbryantia formatexigens DSM 14469]|uniref:Uncharacterized protein n=1 Tax=Marvinbryantia formatexigens DSM 14469 TaxID=478749 RepID=C6L998_9FIRM|nr:hypothetical protein BRYFOR_05188 [Marvinbryantia formatexigens DSM 14469]
MKLGVQSSRCCDTHLVVKLYNIIQKKSIFLLNLINYFLKALKNLYTYSDYLFEFLCLIRYNS